MFRIGEGFSPLTDLQRDRHHGYRLLACLLAVFVGITGASAQTSMVKVASVITQQVAEDTDAVKTIKGKTLVITRFENRCTDEEIDPVVLQEKLCTAFVKAKLCKVVERKKIDNALRELQFNAGGLVDPASQKKLGRFLGASFLMVGTISGDADNLSVDARIYATETGEIIVSADYPGEEAIITLPPDTAPAGGKDFGNERLSELFLKTISPTEALVTSDAEELGKAKRDAVRWLVEEKILNGAGDVVKTWQPEFAKKLYRDPDQYVTKVRPQVEAYYLYVNFAKLMRDVTQIIFGKITPSIAVDTKETILRRPPIPDPAVQTRLASTLLSYGFQVRDTEQAHKVLSRAAVREAIMSDDPKALAILQSAAGELHADLLAIGDSVAQQRTNLDGFDARIEFRIVEASTARLLASIDNTVSVTRADDPKVDPNSDICAKLALQKGAETVSLRMACEMLKAYGQPIFRVRIWGVKDFETSVAIQDELKDNLPGAIISAKTSDFNAKPSANIRPYIILEISTKRSATDIGKALSAVTACKMSVKTIECRALVAEVK